jgi:hypothetical protein
MKKRNNDQRDKNRIKKIKAQNPTKPDQTRAPLNQCSIRSYQPFNHPYHRYALSAFIREDPRSSFPSPTAHHQAF